MRSKGLAASNSYDKGYAVDATLLFASRLHCRCACRSLYRRSRQSYADNAGDRADRLIRDLAAASSGLYLLHYPPLNFFGTVIRGPPGRAVHRVLVFASSLGCSIALTHLIGQREAVLKCALRSACDRQRLS